MKQEICLKVKPRYVNKYKNGYPLIMKEAIINPGDVKAEGTIIRLVDEQNHFLAKGYYGIQNKGHGWVLSRDEHVQVGDAFFKQRLGEAIKRRKHFFDDPETTAFRLFNGEGDGIGGFTIEYFAGYYLIHWYSKGIYEFRKFIIDALKELVEFKAIYQKKRFDTKGQYIDEDDFVIGERGAFPLIVKENGIKFAVYLNDSAMVGVFLDQREVRKTIRDHYAKGKTVLNTFSYTGAFSVAASLGGALKTTSVDLANRSLEKTKEQFNINGINADDESIIVMDVFNYFKYAVKKNLKFDIVILDPPSFARSKKYVFSAEKNYQNLLEEAIAVTEKNGLIIASTNASSFDMRRFIGFIKSAFEATNDQYKIIEEFSLPEDFKTIKSFPEGNYLKVVFIKKYS